MKSLARRLTMHGCTILACNDGWFALAVFGVVLVPVVAIFAYW